MGRAQLVAGAAVGSVGSVVTNVNAERAANHLALRNMDNNMFRLHSALEAGEYAMGNSVAMSPGHVQRKFTEFESLFAAEAFTTVRSIVTDGANAAPPPALDPMINMISITRQYLQHEMPRCLGPLGACFKTVCLCFLFCDAEEPEP